MFDFDEGNNSGGNSEGPWLNFHAREKLDGSMPSRSFSLRSEAGLENVTEKMKKGVAWDLETLRTGWCFSNGTPGVAPEWVWNTTPARFDQAQPEDRGEDRWKKGFSIRLALGKDNAATKADGGSGETVIAVLSGIEDIKFAKGGTSAPQFTVKKWADRPDCLKESVDNATSEPQGEDEF